MTPKRIRHRTREQAQDYRARRRRARRNHRKPINGIPAVTLLSKSDYVEIVEDVTHNLIARIVEAERVLPKALAPAQLVSVVSVIRGLQDISKSLGSSTPPKPARASRSSGPSDPLAALAALRPPKVGRDVNASPPTETPVDNNTSASEPNSSQAAQ